MYIYTQWTAVGWGWTLILCFKNTVDNSGTKPFDI